MDQWKQWADILEALIKSAAIIVAGFWTFQLFVRQRLGFPRINVELKTQSTVLSDERLLLHAEVLISNVGSVVLRSDYAELRLRQVRPAPEEVLSDAAQGYDPVDQDSTQIEWPLFADREWRWKGVPFEVEPGEQDSLHTDFVVPGNIDTVQYYSFLSNPKKRKPGLGWTVTKIEELKPEKETAMSEKKKTTLPSPKTGLEHLQQKQQKRQQPQQQRQPPQQKKQTKKK